MGAYVTSATLGRGHFFFSVLFLTSLAAIASAAPHFEPFLPETDLGECKLPSLRLAVPFACRTTYDFSTSPIDVHVSKGQTPPRLEVTARDSKSVTVTLSRLDVPLPVGGTAWTADGAQPQQPLFTVRFTFDESVLTEFNAKLAAVRVNPKLLLAGSWSKQSEETAKAPFVTWFDGKPLSVEKRNGDTVSTIHLQANEHVNPNHERLGPATYGNENDGYQPAPWIALVPQITLDATVPIPALERPGLYRIEAHSEIGETRRTVFLPGLHVVARRDGDTMSIQALSARDGAPVGGAVATIQWLGPSPSGPTPLSTTTLTLDVDGHGQTTLPPEAVSAWFTVQKGEDTTIVCSWPLDGDREERRASIHLATDRPGYCSGDVVSFRGVAFLGGDDTHYEPVSNRVVHVSMRQSDKALSSPLELRTDERGFFEGELTVRPGLGEGDFNLRASLGGTVQSSDSIALRALGSGATVGTASLDLTPRVVLQGEAATVP